jgi:hypothetical protein
MVPFAGIRFMALLAGAAVTPYYISINDPSVRNTLAEEHEFFPPSGAAEDLITK